MTATQDDWTTLLALARETVARFEADHVPAEVVSYYSSAVAAAAEAGEHQVDADALASVFDLAGWAYACLKGEEQRRAKAAVAGIAAGRTRGISEVAA